jgi:hypothetical protein
LTGFHVNTITFSLEPDRRIIAASLESFNPSNSARFIGTTGTVEFVATSSAFDPPLLWEATADQIGAITAIELSAGQGCFDNVTIEVVPEPSAAVLFVTGLLVALVGLTRRRRP